jgi:hypothetical protein
LKLKTVKTNQIVIHFVLQNKLHLRKMEYLSIKKSKKKLILCFSKYLYINKLI